MKNNILFILLLSISSLVAMDKYSALTYSFSLATGETKDYISKPSFRGIGIEGHKFINPNLSIGLTAQWHVFHDTCDDLVELDFGAINGDQNRTINSMPVLAMFHYNFGNEKKYFFGTGTGPYWVDKRVEIGIAALSWENWHWGVTPEIGVMIPIRDKSSLLISVNYHHIFATKNQEYSYFTIKAGFAWDYLF